MIVVGVFATLLAPIGWLVVLAMYWVIKKAVPWPVRL